MAIISCQNEKWIQKLSNPIKAKKCLVKLGTVKSIINTQLGNLTVECSDKQQYQCKNM